VGRQQPRAKRPHWPLVEFLEGRQLLTATGRPEEVAAVLSRAGLAGSGDLTDLKSVM